MADEKNDLPGFYRDPQTGKYYREGHENTMNSSLKKLKKLRELQYPKHPNINPSKVSNVTQYLRSRELGSLSGVFAKSEYCKMRTFKKSLVEEINLNECQQYGEINSVDVIKGTGNSVLSVWNVKDERRCLIGERTFMGLINQPTLGFKPSPHLAIDLCEGPDCTVICIFRSLRTASCCYGFLPQDGESIDIYTSRWSIPLFCCASAINGSRYGFGCEGFFRHFNRFNGGESIRVKGTVHSLSFNDSGNTVICGIHNGFINLHDLRAKSLSMELEVSSYSVTDTQFLNDNVVIAAGLGDMLKKIDLRKKEVSMDYFGHKCSSLKKKKFSYSNDMLCASGTDKITRIWHLNGSNPIYEMKPVIDPENDTGAWLYSNCNKTYLYHFEQNFQRLYNII